MHNRASKRVRVVVDLDVGEVEDLDTIAERAPIAVSRSAVVRAALRRGVPLIRQDVARGVSISPEVRS